MFWEANVFRFFLVMSVLFALLSCQNNKLKTDEQALVKTILLEEAELEQHEEYQQLKREKALAEKLSEMPQGYRFHEERGVNNTNPPMIIDVASQFNNQKSMKLSAIANTIQYIRMEPVPDSTLPRNMHYKYYLMEDYIIALNLFGIHQFSKEGRFIKTIVKNQHTGIDFGMIPGYVSISFSHTQIGGGTSVWARGNTLFYTYENNNTGQSYIMELDCNEAEVGFNQSFSIENKEQMNALGKVSVNLNPGNTMPPKPKNLQGIFSLGEHELYSDLTIFSLDRNTYVKKKSSFLAQSSTLTDSVFMNVLGSGGDTLASFKKYEQLNNYTQRNERGVDFGGFYEKDGNLLFRMPYNDTVFKVIPPNRIEPQYVFKLGEYKVSMQDGVTPGVSLHGKIIPQEFVDTRDYLFITFVKDGYDCPNSRKNKTVELYYGVCDKVSQKLTIINNDPLNYTNQALKNDLDGGLRVWPKSYMLGKQGEILLSLKGCELKAHVVSEEFTKAEAPLAEKEVLKQFSEQLVADDDVLVIVK